MMLHPTNGRTQTHALDAGICIHTEINNEDKIFSMISDASYFS